MEHFVSSALTSLSPEAAPRGASRVFRCILFVDVAGSLRLTRQVGDECAYMMVQRLGTLVAEAASAHNGEVVRSLGDGFLLIFETAWDALEAATDIQRRVAAELPPELPVRLRVGLHAGDILHAADGVFGMAVYLAARVTNHAHGGEILLTQAVRDLAVHAGYHFSDFGPTALPGFEEPVRLFELRVQAEGS